MNLVKRAALIGFAAVVAILLSGCGAGQVSQMAVQEPAINGNKVDALDHAISDAEQLFSRFTLLRRGKKNYGMISWL